MKTLVLQDLKASLEDLEAFQKAIVDNSKNETVAYCLLEGAFYEVAMLEEFIRKLGGKGFRSIDKTADFIFDVEKILNSEKKK